MRFRKYAYKNVGVEKEERVRGGTIWTVVEIVVGQPRRLLQPNILKENRWLTTYVKYSVSEESPPGAWWLIIWNAAILKHV